VRSLRGLKKLLEGVESMKPRMVVCIGRFFSQEKASSGSYDLFAQYFEDFGNIVRDNELVNLRDNT
jgi:hypothetical protein